MSDAEGIWKGKTDGEVAGAARQLSDYAEETERIIRCERRRRGMAEPSPTLRPIDEDATTSPVVRRYKDAYRIGTALVGLGYAIRIVGDPGP